jgi:predicted lipid-binding transport protein (Tim44 family)
MRINTTMSGSLLPGLGAGVIYFIIALGTGVSFIASIVGGIVIAVIAIVIGLTVRVVVKQRVASLRGKPN